MTWDDHKDAYVLTTGKTIAAPDGILGISPQAVAWGAGDFTLPLRGVTLQEREEIAMYVIAQWKSWASAGNLS